MLQTGNRAGLKFGSAFTKPKPLHSISRIFNHFSKNIKDIENEEEENASISSKSKK